METVKGEHPREPGVEITVKPYYTTAVTRRIIGYAGKASDEAFEDAMIQDSGDNHHTGCECAVLYVPRDDDPEVGGYWDCDSTRSRRRIFMHVTHKRIAGTTVTYRGFVMDDDGDDEGNDGWGYNNKYHIEEWHQRLRSDD